MGILEFLFDKPWRALAAVLCVGFLCLAFSEGCKHAAETERHRVEWRYKNSSDFWKYNQNSSAEKGSPCDCSKSKVP